MAPVGVVRIASVIPGKSLNIASRELRCFVVALATILTQLMSELVLPPCYMSNITCLALITISLLSL